MGNGPSQPFRTKHLIWFRDRAPTSPQSAIASDAEVVGLVSNRVSTGIFLPLKILSKELIQTAFYFVNSEEI